jgi:hypothetical protein
MTYFYVAHGSRQGGSGKGVRPFKKGPDPFSALADFAFFMGLVATALGAELFDVELLGHGAPILVGHVVVFAAIFTAELDEVTHRIALPFRLEGGGV